MTLLAEEGFLDRFCQECGLDLPIQREQVRSGRNSDVWLLSTTRRRAILKHYFPRERDGRDRLGAEFGFLSYLERHRVQGVAQPIGAAPERGWGLYSWLPGSRPTAITQSYVEQAARFIIEINRFRDSPEAATLPAAADACSSWMSHVQLAQRRLTRLA